MHIVRVNQIVTAALSRAGCACAIALVLGSPGCGPTTQPTAKDRQDKALKDPFGYSPDLKNSDMTVSGHGEFDKQELKRDVDHVINP
jgi:hypothetical protein